ncbi:MAG: trigger factor [Actinobacteria bacterium]|nr:trigger factor [Actinomycetota bacterium]
MKTDVEELSPTRVKLTVEVPFDELQPSIDKAYREVGRQVRIPGFRPGRVPARIIDQRVGRAPVLEQAVNDALPELYGKAVQEQELYALGQPEVEITALDDGKELSFTAEVDVRPKIELPELDTLSVTIDNAKVTPDDVEEYLSSLRERFASLKGADRPAESGDFVSIDLSATVDGESVDDAQASGLSYEVGSGSMLEGLDDAVTGMSGGDTKTFSTELAGGDHEGEQAEVTVTVHSVKVKELPDFDDDFAQLASEFDTIGELRADTRTRLEAARQQQQAGQVRDRAVEALLDQVEVPLPDSVVADEAHRMQHQMQDQIQAAGADWDTYLQIVGKSQEEFTADLDEQARRSVKTSLVLDQLARQEDLGVDDAELSYFVTRQAEAMGVAPEVLARQLAEAGQIGAAAAEVLRGKAVARLADQVQVKDEDGNDVSYATLIGADQAEEEAAEVIAEAEVDAAAGADGAAGDIDEAVAGDEAVAEAEDVVEAQEAATAPADDEAAAEKTPAKTRARSKSATKKS